MSIALCLINVVTVYYHSNNSISSHISYGNICHHSWSLSWAISFWLSLMCLVTNDAHGLEYAPRVWVLNIVLYAPRFGGLAQPISYLK